MYTLGIDIGSTTSKCVILKDGTEIAARSIVATGIGTNGPEIAMNQVLDDAGLCRADISCIVATGYGRIHYEGAHMQVSELTCHGMGAYMIFPEVRTLIDIGGQDAKVLTINEKGKIQSFLMNDKCAAGTGRFLDVMAGILQLDVSELEEKAFAATAPAQISSTCTVFAESEVISQLANKIRMEDLVAGICNSVASRVASLAKRGGVKEKVCMSGGVAKNGTVRKAMEQQLGVQILYSPLAQSFGALGAALYAYKHMEKQP